MTRLTKFFCFALLALTLTVTAFAQDALPLPAAADGSAPRTTISLIKPGMFNAIQPGGTFEWSNVNGTGTTLTFKILQTGQVIKWKPSIFCAATCKSLNSPDALFEAGHTGQDVDWWVTTTVAGVKVKSDKSRIIVSEVTAGSLITPTHLAQMSPASITGLTWGDWGLALKYTVIVKDMETGAIVLKTKVTAGAVCYDFSPYPYDKCTYSFGGANPSATSIFKPNRYYQWWVKSVGPTGETAVSNKFTLATLN